MGTNSLLLNSPPSSPNNAIVITPKRRGRKRKYDKMEADDTSNHSRSASLSNPRKKRKITHEVITNYADFYQNGRQTINISENKSNDDDNECNLNQQHFPKPPKKWNEVINDSNIIKMKNKSKWKEDGPTLIILKLLNYFHAFSSHWTTLYYDDYFDVENLFNFNKPFDINRVKLKYIYSDRNNEDDEKYAADDEIQCLLKPHVFYNKELIERLKNQMEQSIVIMVNSAHKWIKEIPTKYPFLFPYHLRKDLFDIFSFDSSRTFKNMIQFLKKMSSSFVCTICCYTVIIFVAITFKSNATNKYFIEKAVIKTKKNNKYQMEFVIVHRRILFQ